MLRADWAFFLELSAYALHGLSPGSVAFGIEEVTEAVTQVAVAVLFVPVGCGHGGEGAVRRVAAAGGRGYIVGVSHELHEDMAAWGAAAILRQPLHRRLSIGHSSTALEDNEESALKRSKQEDGSRSEAIAVAVPKSQVYRRPADAALLGGEQTLNADVALSAATPKASMRRVAPPSLAQTQANGVPLQGTEVEVPGEIPATAEVPLAPWALEVERTVEDTGVAPPEPPAPAVQPLTREDHERDLRRSIKALGKIEALHDKASIPTFAEAMRERFLPELGAPVVFTALADAFLPAKGVAHRKSMVYSAHELLMKKRGRAMNIDDRRPVCFRQFFLRIGGCIRGFKADERQAYIKLVGCWQEARVYQGSDLDELKESWDVD